MKRILVVDDDQDIHLLIDSALNKDFDLLFADSLSKARAAVRTEVVDLIVLDEMLPDGLGSKFCQEVYANRPDFSTPIIMLTRKKELEVKLHAFDSGVDDYVVKPFEPLELKARIKARLKHSSSSSKTITKCGDLLFDLTLQNLSLEQDGENELPVDLTPIEFKILYYLAQKNGSIISRADILSYVWGKQSHVVDRTVDQHISKIRKKIKQSKYTLKSSHGQGYTFVKEV